MLFLSLFPSGVWAQETSGTQSFQIGVVETLFSKVLQENRVLNVYLPEGYGTDSTITYQVIYLLDGSVDEDFIHISGLVQFVNFPWIETLPPSIVVGIANVDRKRDFTFPTPLAEEKTRFPTTGGSEVFMRFLETEVQPFVNAHFRTSGKRMLIGQSLGGLLATEILFKKPELFDDYLIVSPSLWWGNGILKKTAPRVLETTFTQPTRVHVAVGKEGRVMEGDARWLAQKLRKGGRKNLQVTFRFHATVDHATILHEAAYEGFRAFHVPKTKPVEQ